MKHNPFEIQTELSRDLGLTSALAIGIGTMIAAGIFTLSGLAIRDVGSAAVVSFLLAALVAAFTALTYCEFVSIYPESGEGYLYARKTFSPPIAYFVGWTLFLGYTGSCAFYIASLSSYFNDFIWHSPAKIFAGLVALTCLTLLNIKGTKESGSFQVFITVGKVILLIWFILGGLSTIDSTEIVARFSTDLAKIGSSAGMVFITFFGFSAIAASAGEIQNPEKTITRAIFISMAVVTVLYTLVVLVVVAADLTEYSEASMGTAARQFLGPAGGYVIVAGALFSMISASNASIMAGSRVLLSMSRLGHFPQAIGRIHPNTRTPFVSILVVGLTILVFAVVFSLEALAHFADTLLLIALILVNLALIYHRRRFPDIERPFRVPLVPLLPLLGVGANLYLLTQILHHVWPVAIAGTCLIVGVVAFFIWKGSQTEEVALPGAPSRVALGRYAATEGQFRVLVPLANPANVDQLVALASAVASERAGEIVALRVALVPEQMPFIVDDAYVDRERQILELAHSSAVKYGAQLTSLVRVGHHPARAILETARERDCDLILLGWKGFTSTAKRILGEVADAVVSHARSDIMLVKMVGRKSFQRFLLPTAGGEHARHAEGYISSIVRKFGGKITVASVAQPKASKAVLSEINERLHAARMRLSKDNGIEVESKLIRHSTITAGILRESKRYDAVVVGATGRGILPQILFGQIPEQIAKRSTRPVILVKRYHPVRAMLARVMRD